MQFKTNDEIEKIGNSKVTGIVQYTVNDNYMIHYPVPAGSSSKLPYWQVEAPRVYVDQNFKLIN